jgi:hypothetical protein
MRSPLSNPAAGNVETVESHGQTPDSPTLSSKHCFTKAAIGFSLAVADLYYAADAAASGDTTMAFSVAAALSVGLAVVSLLDIKAGIKAADQNQVLREQQSAQLGF